VVQLHASSLSLSDFSHCYWRNGWMNRGEWMIWWLPLDVCQQRHTEKLHQDHLNTPNSLSSCHWYHRPGHSHNRWVDQIRRDNNLLFASLWRGAVNRGHSGVMLRPLLAKRWWLRWRQTVHLSVMIHAYTCCVVGTRCSHQVSLALLTHITEVIGGLRR